MTTTNVISTVAPWVDSCAVARTCMVTVGQISACTAAHLGCGFGGGGAACVVILALSSPNSVVSRPGSLLAASEGVNSTRSSPTKADRSSSRGLAPGSSSTTRLAVSTPSRLPEMVTVTALPVSVAAYTYAMSKVTPFAERSSAGRPPSLMMMPSGDTMAGR